ncbi:hypothetical protein [Plantactinospora sp. B5E13]|uniref:hypothetical protein n=1 Tax=unclassified Plantactinospora TaxID=2631981 RepID=UPI00325EC9C6
MWNGEERRLKLVKSSPQTEPDDVPRQSVRRRRTTARRTVTRRIPGPDPVSAVLERLDEEPVALVGAPESDEAPDDHGPGEAPDGHGRDETTDDQRPDATADGERPDATADGQGPEPAADRRPEPKRRKAVRPGVPRRRGLTVGLAIMLCAALTVAGFFGNRWYQDRALAEAHGQAVTAARQTTVNFVSVSASSVDGDLQRIVAGATGEFREEFLRGQAQVRAAVIENKVESTGSVLRAGLVSGDRRTAVVVVAVDATVKNTHAPDGRVAHYRIQVELARDRDSDTWLVSRLQFVG